MFKSICIMIIGCFVFAVIAAIVAAACVVFLGVSTEVFDYLLPVIGLLFGLWWGPYCFNKWGR